MKKLALALVCLVSVAFFASCDPKVEHPEPSIAVIAEEGYLTDGQVIDMYEVYNFGFRVAANAETQKDLAKLVVSCNGVNICDSVISGKEFVYRDIIMFTDEEKEIVGEAEIIAIVTDAAGQTNQATIKVELNAEDYLEASDFTWNRHGGQDATGLEPFGLKWERNAKEIYAVIEPLDDALLYRFDAGVWDRVQTEADLAALLTEATPIDQFKEVSCTQPEMEYDIVLATTYMGFNYLIHVTHSEVYTFKGTDITITGQYK